MKKIILLLSILFISVLYADTAKMQKTQVPGYYRFMAGNYEITSIYDGYSNLALDTYKGTDAASAEASIKKEYSHVSGSGKDFRLKISVNTFLINTGKDLILIDTGSDFSGVGAFDQALKRLGIDYETIFACDMDKYARQTFIHNYGKPKYYPENVYDREIPSESLDIYITSPPCQAFSLAGKRKGEEDKRGILFYNSHEFIKKNNPRYFIFENVKGLLSDDNGKTFARWIDYLGGKSVNGNPVIFPHEESVSYHVYHKVLNAKNYGVPQNRERVFIIGIRDDPDNNFSFPKEIPLIKRLKDILEENVDEKYYLSDKQIEYMQVSKFEHSNRIHDIYKVSPTLTTMQGGGQEPKIKIKSATSKGYEIAENWRG